MSFEIGFFRFQQAFLAFSLEVFLEAFQESIQSHAIWGTRSASQEVPTCLVLNIRLEKM
jgi:hypothetical protein